MKLFQIFPGIILNYQPSKLVATLCRLDQRPNSSTVHSYQSKNICLFHNRLHTQIRHSGMCLKLGFRKIRLEASDVGAHKVDLFISGRVSAEIVGKVRVGLAAFVEHALDEMIANVETSVGVEGEFVVY
jgi:hypothetical protein